MKNMKKFIVSTVAVSSIGLSAGLGTAYSLWNDNEYEYASLIKLSQTELLINSNLNNLSGTDTAKVIEDKNLTKKYEQQKGILKDQTINNLTTDHKMSEVIEFDASSTTHRGIRSSVDGSSFVNAVSESGGKAYAGWMNDENNCSVSAIEANPALLDTAKDKTFLSAYDKNSDQNNIREVKGYYCLTAELPDHAGENGTYTNVGTVTGNTGDDAQEVSASDSWTTDVIVQKFDYSSLGEKLKNPVITVDTTTFRK